MKNPTLPGALIALIVLGPFLGCANIVEGSKQTRIQRGEPERVASPPDYHVHVTDEQPFDDERPEPVVHTSTVRLKATKVTTTTIRTPRTEQQVELILPYSPFRETLEFLSSPIYLLWAIPTWSWDQWFAMANPALNSETMWKGSHVERITSSSPVEPDVEILSRTDRIAARIKLQLDDLPPLHVSIAAEGSGTEVELVDLLTAPLIRNPMTLRASIRMEGKGEPSISTLGIESELGTRLFRAQRSLLDPSSGRHPPSELAAAVLRLADLGLEKRSSNLRLSSSLIFGTQTMDQALAAEHIGRAERQKNAGLWVTAQENISAARALDARVQPDWDQLEADVLEKRALGSLGAGAYDLARAGLLEAATVDPTRQQRLAPFITMSIEASDRAAERQATQESRKAFLAIERDRADADAALARSSAARLAAAAVGLAPETARAD